MLARRFGVALSVWLMISLSGCGGPVAWYHDIEGGAISQKRQAPPGANLPYPNLADVPPPRATLAGMQASIAAASHGAGVSPPSPGALAGLELPTAPPPPPDVPGLHIATSSAPAPTPSAEPAAPAPAITKTKPPAPPVALAFRPGSAVLPFSDLAILQKFAAARGTAHVLAGGFGDGSLPLAIARARRLAAGLTAAGVPPEAIALTTMAAGSGGFVQLVY